MISHQVNLSLKNPILSNHKAYGQEILPGLAYIDLIYQVFRQHGYSYNQLELRNLSIYHPLTVGPDYNVILDIICMETREGQWRIHVEGREQRGGISAADKKRYIAAEMHRTEPVVYRETLELERIKQWEQEIVDMEEVYRQCRGQDLVHTGFMKAAGKIYGSDTAAIIDISLGQDALSSAAGFMFHPTLIDGSGIGSRWLHSSLLKGERRLFVPLFYESFLAAALIQTQCITRVRTSTLLRKKELLHLTMEFFNETGKKIGELKNFIIKLVREDGSINPKRKNPQPSIIVPKTSGSEPTLAHPSPAPSPEMESFLRQLLANRLKKPLDQIPTRAGYYEMGLDSPGLLEIVQAIEAKIGTPLPPTLLFEYTTIAELSAYLTENYASQFHQPGQISPEPAPIKSFSGGVQGGQFFQKAPPLVAIIGMAGRYPGARNLQEFWQNLQDGRHCITEIPTSRWDRHWFNGVRSPSGKSMSRWGGFLDDPAYFDPQFFRISPREAEILDPQERLFLETCWEALEDAGYTPQTLAPPRGRDKRRRVGVFAGVMHKDYTQVEAEAVSRGQAFPLSLSCGPIANRVSYFCNFHGPSMSVDTACSSSLTAIHLALESIWHGESEVAIAGGVNLSLHPNKYLTYGMADMHSSDGYCRSFGKGGSGYVSAEGIGAVLLKPLANALRDRDHIYAVIKGSTINHGGTVSGITVPSPVGQADMIRECLEKTGIHPRTISCIEAHGTGTPLGDPIEVQGLVKAFRHYTRDRQFCSIGSVKSNIGHTESTAGIAGLTRLVLQLYYRTLVPSLHSEELNPYIDFQDSPFYVQQKVEAWKRPVIKENGREVTYPRRGGLSSFGATGSNAHVIVEEYLPNEMEQKSQSLAIPDTKVVPAIVPLSARNKERLYAYAGRLLEFLEGLLVDRKSPARWEEKETGDRELLEAKIRGILSRVLHVEEGAVEVRQEWSEYGVDPFHMAQVKEKIIEELNVRIDVNDLIQANSIASVAAHLMEVHPEAPEAEELSSEQETGAARRELKLADLAYTLQVGREAMEERVAFIVKDIPGLIQKLAAFLQHQEKIEFCYWGQVKQNRDADSGSFVHDWIRKGQVKKLAELWAKGFDMDWELLYGETESDKPRRISLPTYPFARQRYWVPGLDSEPAARSAAVSAPSLHPLLHQNISDFQEHRFSSTFTGREFFLADHQVKGQRVLPGVAFLEMARAAGHLAGKKEVLQLKNIVWAQPIPVNQKEQEVDILLHPESDRVVYQISTPGVDVEGPVVHSRGLLFTGFDHRHPPAKLNLEEIQQRCDSRLEGPVCYESFHRVGISYGKAMQSIQTFYCNESESLAKVQLPAAAADGKDDFMLHPSLMDAALQTTLLLTLSHQEEESVVTYLPYALGQVDVYGPTTDSMYAYARFSRGMKPGGKLVKYDIDLVDEQGNICVALKELTARPLSEEDRDKSKKTGENGILYATPQWKSKAIEPGKNETMVKPAVLFLGGFERETLEHVQRRFAGIPVHGLPGPDSVGPGGAAVIISTFQMVFNHIKSQLETKPKSHHYVVVVVPTGPQKVLYTHLAGLLQTAALEHPNVKGKVLRVGTREYDTLGQLILKELNPDTFTDVEIRYMDETNREVKHFAETRLRRPSNGSLIKEGGVYWITGGLGGLGKIFARFLGQVKDVKLILSGRSTPDEIQTPGLESLEKAGINVRYLPCDVGRLADVKKTAAEIKKSYGKLDGIIHGAGVLRDSLLLKKTAEEIHQVLQPKAAGFINIDEVTRDEALDFIVLFSSIAAVLGNIGQCDYSAANMFLDDYTAYRQELVQAGKRFGKTISINWPLWQEGGIRVETPIETFMKQKLGLGYLDTRQGCQTFETILNSDQTQVLAVEGHLGKLRETLFSQKDAAVKTAPSGLQHDTDEPNRLPGEKNPKAMMTSYLKQVIGTTLKVAPGQMDSERSLEKYGLDSIMVLEINNKLEPHFPGLSRTLFFEYSTINDLAAYFIESHQEAVLKLLAGEDRALPLLPSQERKPTAAGHPGQKRLKNRANLPLKDPENHSGMLDSAPDPGQAVSSEFVLRQIEKHNISLDEVLSHLQLEVLPSRPSPAIESVGEKDRLQQFFSPFQSFAPFENVVETFSLSRLFSHPHQCREDIQYVIEKQIELRQVLFFKEDFGQCRKVLDIGCGTAADIIEIARLYPGITAHGLTISPGEAEFAETLIRREKLENRVKVFCEDNSKYVYQDSYDLIFGIQVLHFLNDFSQKDRLFEKLSSAMAANGKILLAEYICHLNGAMHDPLLNVTVHTAEEWARLLGNHHLIIEEIIDVSREIKNFLHDPQLERNIEGLDRETRVKLKQYSKQVVSLEERWVSYCLLKIVKDPKSKSSRQGIKTNLKKIKNKKSYQEAKREMTASRDSITYKPALEGFADYFNLPDHQKEKITANEPILLHENELENHPGIAQLIRDIDGQNPPVGYERLLYPYFFICPGQNKYLRVIIDHPNKIIIPFLPMDQSIYQELSHYSQKTNQQILMVDQYHHWIDPAQTRLIPLGVWQNLDIKSFTLKGNRMRKCRYLVEKFKKSGEVLTREYHPGSSLPLKEMRDLMVRWSESKKNVIFHSWVCMEELLQQKLPPGHRAFLTFHNKKLCSVVVLGKSEEGVVVMDQEFYDPQTAPPGHLEYTIVEIIRQLKKEEAKIFSLGLTWYPFIFADHPKADTEGWTWLKEQNNPLLNRIFQQAKTNYQFKKKFGSSGEPIFAYLPRQAPFTLLLNYWPVFYQNSLTAAQLAGKLNRMPLPDPDAPDKTRDRNPVKHHPDKDRDLESDGSTGMSDQADMGNPALDLSTDSWFSIQSDTVKKRSAYLKTKSQQNTIEVVQRIFPFKHILLTAQGRTAEMFFYRAFPKTKQKIVTTIPWTTTLMHQLDNGFDVVEIPDPSVHSPGSTHLFKGEMNLDALREQLEKNAGEIALVGLEVLSNASGGHPVRLSHMDRLKTLLGQYGIPLVLDASRIVRNAILLQQYEDAYQHHDVWEIVRQTAGQADHIVTSLSKDFAVPLGGLIATNDDGLARDLRKTQLVSGQTSAAVIESMIIQALSEQDTILHLVSRQMAFTRRLGEMLVQARVPILEPAYGHAVVIDVSRLSPGETNARKKERFLRLLARETGIQAGIHQVGKQKNTNLDSCIRLAFPLGLTKAEEESIYGKLRHFFIKFHQSNPGKKPGR